MQRPAIRSQKHQTVIGEPGTHQQPFGELPLPMLTHRGGCARVEDDRASASGCLWQTKPHRVVDRDHRLHDRGRPAARSTSAQRRPKHSPRRIPVVATTTNAACNRCSVIGSRNARTSGAVHVVITGREVAAARGGSQASAGLARYVPTGRRRALWGGQWCGRSARTWATTTSRRSTACRRRAIRRAGGSTCEPSTLRPGTEPSSGMTSSRQFRG